MKIIKILFQLQIISKRVFITNKNNLTRKFIAINEDHYLEKAIQFQEDLEKLKLLRKSLRERILTSPLFDADSFANEFSSILKKIWIKNIDPSN